MTSPSAVAAEANGSRIPSDVRAKVAAVVQRLTMKLLDPGAGVASRDRYVYNTRKSIGKGDALPVQMVMAVAYDDIQKGRSAAEVTAWMREAIEEIVAWEAERDGEKITPPDILPVLRIENREECGENDAALQLVDNPTSIEAHERYIREATEEIDAQVDAVDLARQRLVLMRRQA